MYRHWTHDLEEVQARLWAPQVDAMDRATWRLAGWTLVVMLGVFVGWG